MNQNVHIIPHRKTAKHPQQSQVLSHLLPGLAHTSSTTAPNPHPPRATKAWKEGQALPQSHTAATAEQAWNRPSRASAAPEARQLVCTDHGR